MPSPQRSYPIEGARGGDNTVGLLRAPNSNRPHGSMGISFQNLKAVKLLVHVATGGSTVL